MTTLDLRDVFNLPAEGQPAPRPSKKAKNAAPRQNLKGLAREVQSLGGNTPIALVPEASVFKRRRFTHRKPAAKWVLKPFRNSAREDQSLILRHWRRKTENTPGPDDAAHGHGGQDQDQEMVKDALGLGYLPPTMDMDSDGDEEIEDSAFAKYNVQIDIATYTDEQYDAHLQNDDWSRQETDYLMEVVKAFELRWPLIWDRYEYTPSSVDGEVAPDGTETKVVVPVAKPRTLEQLKQRYYSIAAKMMEVRTPVQYMTQQEFELYEIMASFSPQWETQRKAFIANALSRTKEEVREEENLLLELRRMQLRDEQFNAQRRELFQRLDFPYSDQDMSSIRTTQGIQSLLQSLYTADRSKKRKSYAAMAESTDPSPATGVPLSAGGGPASARRDSMATSARDSALPLATPSSATTKKGGLHQQHFWPERKLTELEEAIYGVTHHDRLGAGPTFRSEKINKLFSHKSNTQHTRITNALAEIDIQARLLMPTASITVAFEQLLAAITSLLDLRKQADKAEADLKVELRKKEERERAKAAAAWAGGGGGGGGGRDASVGTAASMGAEGKPETWVQEEERGRSHADAGAEEAEVGTDGEDEEEEDEEDGDEDENEDEDEDDEYKAPNMRDASVLSTSSEKSAKRQKR